MKPIRVLLLLSLFGHLMLAAQDESCSDVMTTSLSSVTFLQEQQDVRESPCIVRVIKQLGLVRDVGAVHTLVGYLDFVDPATRPRPDGSSDVRPAYPAVEALFRIGKAATIELLSAIQYGKSPIARENAAKAFQAIYRDDLATAIHLVRNEELASSSAIGQRRLQEVLHLLIEDCSGRTKDEAESCRAVLQANRN